MSLKNSYTTSDCLQWDSATNLVRKLYRDKNYRISLLVGCGIFFGLRISDLLQLTWEMLLNKDARFTITEKKTSKRREVRINKEFQNAGSEFRRKAFTKLTPFKPKFCTAKQLNLQISKATKPCLTPTAESAQSA